jgi:hypothetical protein
MLIFSVMYTYHRGSISEEARMRKHMVVTEASSELIPDGEQQFG